ncbi:MAG: metallophosphoesterase [Ignavibacteria bacterium]|nr:metallophosphoesterase [Ignavibacteria bacterium]
MVIDIFPLYVMGSLLYSIIDYNYTVTIPENVYFDYLVMYPAWVGIITIVQCVLIILLIDILFLLLKAIVRVKRIKFLSKYNLGWLHSRLILILIIFFAVYVPLRVIYDYNSVKTRSVTYTNENLSKELDGFKITFIADIQADRFTNDKRLEKFVSEVNRTNPDLVLIAGDIVTSTSKYINLSAEYLGKIKSKYGTYSCVGDHDLWAIRGKPSNSLNHIKTALQNNNVKMLDDEKLTLNINHTKINVNFVTNTYIDRPTSGLLHKLNSNMNKNELNILLTHQPSKDLIDFAVKEKFNLFLAGHTHGGQVTLLFPFFNLTPTLIETRFVKGDFWFGKTLVIVNKGLGMSLAPIRYNSTPEIVEIIIKSKEL